MKVYQVTEQSVDSLISVLGDKIRQAVPGSVHRSIPTANSQAAQGNNTAASGDANASDELDGAVTQALEQAYPRIDDAIRSGNVATITEWMVAGPAQILRRSGIDLQGNQHLFDQFESKIRREITKYMANHIRRSGIDGTNRNNWEGFARRRPNHFAEIVADPSKASEIY